jgi:hypothetical protein
MQPSSKRENPKEEYMKEHKMKVQKYQNQSTDIK